MSRRRTLRLPDSSSDEDSPLFATTTTPIPTGTTTFPILVDLTDDEINDFVDTHSNFSSPPSPDSPIALYLESLGLKLKRQWLDSCCNALSSTGLAPNGFGSMDVGGKSKVCFERFLEEDMNVCGGGVLPRDVCGMHLVKLEGPFVLQVDEITNISAPLKGRYQNAPAGIKRCLKLSMTDGVQRVFGMEYRPIKDIGVLSPAGLKVVISNVELRRGLLMLVPEVLDVLGGVVEDLEAARKRLFEEVNKPPRGKRTRNGELPSLVSRATRAAWPQNSEDNGHANISTSQNADHFLSSNQGGAVPTSVSRATHAVWPTNNEGNGHANNNNSASNNADLFPSFNQGGNLGVFAIDTREGTAQEFDVPNRRLSFSSTLSQNANLSVEEISMIDATVAMSRVDVRDTIIEESTSPTYRSNTEINSSSNTVPDVREIDMVDEVEQQFIHSSHEETPFMYRSERNVEQLAGRTCRPVIGPISSSDDIVDEVVQHITCSSHEEIPFVFRSVRNVEELSATWGGPNSQPSSSSIAQLEIPEVDMTDEVDDQHLPVVNEDIPFTYMASLQMRWITHKDDMPSVQGRVKCIVTGVKGFKYKGTAKFELFVYIDDGSIISVVLIDHNIVQKRLGHPPQEVTSALSSPDTNIADKMKENMRQFQFFLTNFEGTMLIEYNHRLDHPFALEMEQGCSMSDAWLLLKRLRTSTPQTLLHHHPEPALISS